MSRGISGLTAWQIVRQSHACHPDWSVDTHIAYLTAEEGIDLADIGLFPISNGSHVYERREEPRETVSRWLAEIAQLPAL